MPDDATPPEDRRPAIGSVDAPHSEVADLETARRVRALREQAQQHDTRLTSLNEELGTLTEQLGVLTEQVGQLGLLTRQVRQTNDRHMALAAAVSEDLAPRLDVLHQLVTDEVARLRGEVDALLADRKEQKKNKNEPVDWAALTAEQAAVQWPILARWVGDVLVPRYALTRDDLPDCWALHVPVVAELSWLRSAYVEAYLKDSAPSLAADWHVESRPAVLTRIRELIKPDECPPGKHAPARATPVQVQSRNGTLPRTEPADPDCWWPFYDRAYHLDLAVRRTRDAAGSLDWSPAHAGA